MRATSNTQKVLSVFLMLVWVMSPVSAVFADSFSSTNFKAKDPVTNNFGGSASSTSFSSVQSGGQSVTGESTSTSYAITMGYAYFETFTPRSGNWQWFSDETNETPTAALASENVAPSDMGEQDVTKLRITVHEIADIGSSGQKFRLQYSTSSDFSSGGIFVSEQTVCNGSSQWCYADGAGVDNAIVTTSVLTDPDSCVASVGDGCGTHNEYGTSTSLYTHKKSASSEYEFTITQSGAAINTVYFFRLFDVAASSSVAASSTYPSLSTGGSSLTFTVDGLDSGTVTEGQTTGVTTTPTSIPFGTLPFGSPTAAAQRLTVTTNANQGYQVYALADQGLIDQTGAEIAPVTGTDSTPLGWSTACDTNAAGCYGYHTGEDVLSGGSTRFSADDTFASFSNTPQEIGFSAVPAVSKQTDVVVRVLARTSQDAGAYASSIMYIIVPVF